MNIIESAKDMLKGTSNMSRSFKDVDLERSEIRHRLDNVNLSASELPDDYHMPKPKDTTTMTLESGNPVDDNSNSMTAGERGPVLLQDIYLLEKIQHFTREKIPERMVHARGSGAYGYFEYTEDISKYCKAKLFQKVGEKIPLFARFSLVVVSKGEPETTRDLRGFAMKFYTEEGNWDLLCTNLPVFPVRDAIKMMDMVHAMTKHPQTNLYDANAFWDFFSQSPESIHALTMMFTNRGINDGYRKMHAYGNHTFQMVNAKDEVFFVKFHLISDQGAKGLTLEESKRIAGEDQDYYTRDLYDNISQGNFPSWTFCLQVMPEKDALNYKYDILQAEYCPC
jgi:catalase